MVKPEPPKQETPKPPTPKISRATVVKVHTAPPQPPPTSTLSVTLLNSLQDIRRRLELSESDLTRHLHVPLGENSVHECSVHIQKLQVCNFSFIVLSN